MPSDAILEVSDLRGGYDATPVLHGIDLDVPRDRQSPCWGEMEWGRAAPSRRSWASCPDGPVRCGCAAWRFRGLTRPLERGRAWDTSRSLARCFGV